MAESLYGIRDPSKTKHKPISSSTSLAFSSNLSALISSSSKPKTPGPTRSRPSQSDIFTSHNKNVKKRSAADMEQAQEHKTKHDIGAVSTSELHQSKRKMEEKVRLYNAMKRGEYIGRGDDYDNRGLVDFDRKWADSQTLRPNEVDTGSENGSASSDSENDDHQQHTTANKPTIEYLDEFGRLRHGSASEARRAERRQRLVAAAATESTTNAAHPARPDSIIYGDTVQHRAFNPDTAIAEKMEAIARKRDKSATPPPATHYDANAEIRNRGTGFYGFSRDEELRKTEMADLEKQRAETERMRMDKEEMKTEKEQAKEKRRREIEERRALLAEKRSRKEADRFLDGLELDGG